MKNCCLWILLSVAACACTSNGRVSPIVGPIGPPVESGALTLTPIEFASTDKSQPRTVIRAEEGHLSVPERHDAPDGRKIVVHFVRFASTAPAPRPPIVYLAGGPGGSGTWSASGDRFPLFQRLREVADVIAYDQRGAWGTDPYMVCPGTWSLPLDEPVSEAGFSLAQRDFLQTCASHWSEVADLSAYNTVESAHDLESLRRALGVPKITLWGISYGTHLALAYMRAYPDRVANAVLAGIEGPDHTYKLPERMDAVLKRVADEIAADPQAGRAIPDLVGSLKNTLKQLEEQPVTVTVEGNDVTVGADDLRLALYSSLGEREDIEKLAERALPVLRGDYSNVARASAQERADRRELVMALSMDCASGVSQHRQAAIREQAKSSIMGDIVNARLRSACEFWPVQDLGEQFRSLVEVDVPVLFVSGTLDVKTPPENAEDVLRGFPRGRHLVIHRGSHDDDLLLSSTEIADAIVEFLVEGRAPERIELPPLRFETP